MLVVTLVNRMASIALSLLPALLVAREAGVAAAAATMGLVRAAGLVGTFGAGFAADRHGLGPTLVGGMLLASLGTAGMAVSEPLPALVACAAIAQVGAGTFPTVARLVLQTLVPVEEQREALAWQRSTANLGLVLSFGTGTLLGSYPSVLLGLDAAASLGAALLAARLPTGSRASGHPAAPAGPGGEAWAFAWSTAMVGAWALAYEAYLTAAAAQLRTALGPAGVSWYSGVMLLNVVGCSLLGVALSRRIDDPRWSAPLGALLLLVGAGIGVGVPGSRSLAVVGIALVTAGELVFTSTSQFVWMSLLPAWPARGRVFSAASTVVALLRALGGALAFPAIVDAGVPAAGMIALALPVVALCAAGAPVWSAFRRAGGVR